jgi:hypothetical protein
MNPDREEPQVLAAGLQHYADTCVRHLPHLNPEERQRLLAAQGSLVPTVRYFLAPVLPKKICFARYSRRYALRAGKLRKPM